MVLGLCLGFAKFLLPHKGYRMKVLIVDSSGNYEKLFDDILELYHFNIKKISNLKKIQSTISEFSPLVLMVAIYTPSEIDRLVEIKQNSATANLPTIAFLAKPSLQKLIPEDLELFEAIQEPIKIKMVRHVIQRWTHFGTLYRK
jgi:DNA-binding NtrC family response regulator